MGWGGIRVTTADKWFSKAVRLSKDYTCERCHRVGGPTKDDYQMQNCHIIGRRNNATRYSTWNVLCMCVTCHQKTSENPNDFKEWLVKYLGQEHLDRNELTARGILKPTKPNLKMISDHYRKQYNHMVKTGERELESWN